MADAYNEPRPVLEISGAYRGAMTSSLPRSAAVSTRLEILEETPSTNDVLVSAAADADGWPDFSVVVTDTQTHGRGRLGRVWVSPPGTTLAVSVLVRADASLRIDALGWLPLAAGLAMTRAVREALPGRDDVSLKWPNDVLVGGRKISGVLSELVVGAVPSVVVGAGVNLTMTEEQLPVPTATSLVLAGAEHPDPDAVLSAYLREFRGLVDSFRAAGGDAQASGLQAAVTEACGTVGSRVNVELPGGNILAGIARGIDASGRILVQADGSPDLTPVSAGDVTHLRAR
ncbi:BirA family transcriptional regulator, biotin operon repressor / biotin-[acetyl-CoA-carboxylase] ligase [Mycetocola miduiensis]|uniref:biotin--[biotin carboxyl-carrier protein] ligase n=2 Tax=Mycetocola miduiensis TaxID=995034 RepID=A0A1I5DYY1_9MICO|nr:BirA family transcriptional regulator, biotin operon repressor / biotin-[acetyl-CoA-carboxylase] ligase [Mycetocola miduiensis]